MDSFITNWLQKKRDLENFTQKLQKHLYKQGIVRLISEDGKDLLETSIAPNSLCIACCDKTRECVFIPCFHFVYCHTCILKHTAISDICPICRKNVYEYRLLYT